MPPGQKRHSNARTFDVEAFFARHIRGVSARLETFTERAVGRQRAAYREALRREALLEEKQGEVRLARKT
jgi:hypothetical protein